MLTFLKEYLGQDESQREDINKLEMDFITWYEEIGKSPEELIDLELKQIEENMMLLKELKLQGMYCNFGKCTCDFCARF